MLNKHGKFDVPGIDSLVSGLCGEDEDDDLLEITTDEQTTDRLIEERIQDVDVNALSGLFLRWSNLACTATPRRGNSGRQQRRKALHAIKLANCMPRGALLKYFAVVQEQDYHIDGHFPDMAPDEPPAVNETVATMQIAQTTLKAGLALIHNNARLEKRNKELSFFCKLQYLSVLQYFYYYPKFHCELNYIEMVWAYSKKKLRRTCTYNYHDLCRELPEALHDVPVEFHRRALRHCFRFMSGYRHGLKGPLLD
jgi:hypothetical protein